MGSVGSIAVYVAAGVSSPMEEAGTDSVAVTEVSRTVEDGASCSDYNTRVGGLTMDVPRSCTYGKVIPITAMRAAIRAIYWAWKANCCSWKERSYL